MGRKLAIVRRSCATNSKGSSTAGAASDGTRNSPGRRRGSPYTISAAVAWMSGLKALRMQSRATGKELSQVEPQWQLIAFFSCL